MKSWWKIHFSLFWIVLYLTPGDQICDYSQTSINCSSRVTLLNSPSISIIKKTQQFVPNWKTKIGTISTNSPFWEYFVNHESLGQDENEVASRTY